MRRATLEDIEAACRQDTLQSKGLTKEQLEERGRMLYLRNHLSPQAVEEFFDLLAMAAISVEPCCQYHSHKATAKSAFDLVLQLKEYMDDDYRARMGQADD